MLILASVIRCPINPRERIQRAFALIYRSARLCTE